MDEPFGALDAQTRALMQEALLAIWSEYRIPVLFVTHDVDEAVCLGDRIPIMGAVPGRVVAIPVGLGRPRTAAMTGAPSTGAARRNAWRASAQRCGCRSGRPDRGRYPGSGPAGFAIYVKMETAVRNLSYSAPTMPGTARSTLPGESTGPFT